MSSIPASDLIEYFEYNPNLSRGVYIIEMHFRRSFKLGIKLFSGNTFLPGWYYYAGSAQKGIRHRIFRHLRLKKKIHWHIDHLTTHPLASITSIFILPEAEREMECSSIHKLIKIAKVDFAVKKFGNGDCDNCTAHLLYSENRLHQSHFISLYHSIVRLIPSSRDIF